MYRFFKISYKYLKWTISLLILTITTYLIFAIIFSIIPVNRDYVSDNEIDIYIKSNGVHLDIVLPIRNEIKDWTTDIWIDSSITHIANYISFGWGDREFYLNTPEWSDLKMRTAMAALFLNNPSLLHIDYYKNIHTSDKCKIISVNKEQYKAIVNYIESSFLKDVRGNKIIIQGIQYNKFDCFYEARNSYSLFLTCNTWTNNCLKESGIKASLWTPFDKGTLYHYRKKGYVNN
jgi:uncharacterized protein (TIGR02117 family)